jgi:hypothetical protein
MYHIIGITLKLLRCIPFLLKKLLSLYLIYVDSLVGVDFVDRLVDIRSKVIRMSSVRSPLSAYYLLTILSTSLILLATRT